MAAKTVLVCSNGVNRGCGSIAVSVEQLLHRAGYRGPFVTDSTARSAMVTPPSALIDLSADELAEDVLVTLSRDRENVSND